MALRHEWKHRIDTAGLLALRARLGAVLQRDPHALGGSYQVRSLYFDNLADKALREKLESVNHREKFRLRFYNGDLSLLVLEKKTKTNGLCGKAQAPLTIEEARALLEGRHQELGASSPLLGELRRKMDSQGLRPKAIVEYTREPFLYGPGNVRVTLDYNIRTALSPGGDWQRGHRPGVAGVRQPEKPPEPLHRGAALPGLHQRASGHGISQGAGAVLCGKEQDRPAGLHRAEREGAHEG